MHRDNIRTAFSMAGISCQNSCVFLPKMLERVTLLTLWLEFQLLLSGHPAEGCAPTYCGQDEGGS